MSLQGETLTIFVSTPMRDRTYEQITSDFSQARRVVSKKNPGRWVRVIPTYLTREPPESTNCDSVWYLGESLKKMAYADLVVFTPNWKKGRGCRIEHECAKAYGFPILELKKEDYDALPRQK